MTHSRRPCSSGFLTPLTPPVPPLIMRNHDGTRFAYNHSLLVSSIILCERKVQSSCGNFSNSRLNKGPLHGRIAHWSSCPCDRAPIYHTIGLTYPIQLILQADLGAHCGCNDRCTNTYHSAGHQCACIRMPIPAVDCRIWTPWRLGNGRPVLCTTSPNWTTGVVLPVLESSMYSAFSQGPYYNLTLLTLTHDALVQLRRTSAVSNHALLKLSLSMIWPIGDLSSSLFWLALTIVGGKKFCWLQFFGLLYHNQSLMGIYVWLAGLHLPLALSSLLNYRIGPNWWTLVRKFNTQCLTCTHVLIYSHMIAFSINRSLRLYHMLNHSSWFLLGSHGLAFLGGYSATAQLEPSLGSTVWAQTTRISQGCARHESWNTDYC